MSCLIDIFYVTLKFIGGCHTSGHIMFTVRYRQIVVLLHVNNVDSCKKYVLPFSVIHSH